MSLARPIKRISSDVLPLSCANKGITRISRPYASTTTTALLGRQLSQHRQICCSTIRQYPTEVDRSRHVRRGGVLVSTLDPSALQPSDYVETLNRNTLTVRPSTQAKSPHPTRIRYTYSAKQDRHFPPNTKGFFYLHRPPTTYQGSKDTEITVPVHPAAGQLRFRLVDSPDPTKFPQGSDLMINHRPWFIPLIDMWRSPGYQKIYEALISQTERDNIQAFITRSRETAGDAHCIAFDYDTPFLNNILQPFVLDFSTTFFHLGLLDPDCIVKYRVHRPFAAQSIPKSPNPYSGKAVCRLEPAIARSLRNDRMGLTIRVLKWVEPPNPDDVLFQAEGEILKRWYPTPKDEFPYFNGSLTLPRASRELLLKAFPNQESWPVTLWFKSHPVHSLH